MFSSAKQRLLLVFFVVIILSIPIGAYFYSEQREAASDSALESPAPSPAPKTITKEPVKTPKPVKKIDLGEEEDESTTSADLSIPTPTPSAVEVFGPSLNMSILMEGRPKTYQAARVFVGIAAGAKVVKPTYLLIFNTDFPGTGVFNGLSLAGLTVGQTYTAYLKGPAQIDAAATFTLGPSVNNLNAGTPLKLLTGDLNEDNVINSADFSIASSSFGANENSDNWNPNIDFNRDGLINSVDISYVVKNFGKTGDSGPVTSTPGSATSSASLRLPIGGPEEASQSPIPNPPGQNKGYWMWVPQL